MKAIAVFVVYRVVDVSTEPEQTLEEALECWKDSIIDDPFSFIDHEGVHPSASVTLIKDLLV